MTNEDKFKVGDIITFEKYENNWSSHFSFNAPSKLKYPLTVKLLDIKHNKGTYGYISGLINVGGKDYGVCLNHSTVRHATKEEISNVGLNELSSLLDEVERDGPDNYNIY